jgi:hypothetical protein
MNARSATLALAAGLLLAGALPLDKVLEPKYLARAEAGK